MNSELSTVNVSSRIRVRHLRKNFRGLSTVDCGLFHNLLDAGWDQLDGDYVQTGLGDNDPFDLLTIEKTVVEEGYAYIFLSNENPTQVDIHFDDLKVVHKKTNVIQYNEYYPFGLQASTSWTRENNTNNYLYNAANELNTNTGWYEMFYRGYDPALGRMLQVDPLATKFASHSPYNYALNSPALLNDPRGAQAQAPPGVSESAWRRITTDRNDPHYMDHWYEDFAVYAANQGGNSAHVDPKDFGAVINAFLTGSFKVGNNSAEYFYVHEGASVYVDAQGNPIEGSEFGGNTVFYDIIDLTTIVSRTTGSTSQDGRAGHDFGDFFKDAKTGATVMRGLASTAKIAEKEIFRQRRINRGLTRSFRTPVTTSLRTITTISKVAGGLGVLASWGIAGVEVYNGTDNTSTWVNTGINTVLIGAAILGGPITVGIAGGAAVVYGVSYLIWGDEMDAAIDNNIGYR